MSGPTTALAVVDSQQPASLLHQLCKAFIGRCEARFDHDSGYVNFGYGRCELKASRHRLTVTALAWEPADCDRIQALVARQLERAGRRERLKVVWR